MLPFNLLILLNSLLLAVARPQTANDAPQLTTQPIGKVQTRPTVVYKPRSLSLLQQKRRESPRQSPFPDPDPLEWDAVEVLGPNVDDRHTLAQLARMAGNAYALPHQKNWYDVDPAWAISFPFGWEEEDGFRGHVFLSSDNNTVILSIKGTTLQGPTSRLDKFNDNLLFSCCCGHGAWILRTVCDCYASRNRCDDRCLTDALVQESLFYSVGTKLVDDLFRIYPTANLWLVGHSLGGALASLLGATYGLPAVAFESPGERIAAHRLHLPLPPAVNDSNDGTSLFPPPRPPRPPPMSSPLADYITHVYHTADPIPFGTCSGLYSTCATAGYALETRCHLGKSIILDTVNKLRWLVDVRKHVVKEVVHLLDLPSNGGREVDWGEEDGGDDGDGEDDDDPEDPPDPWNSVSSAFRSNILRLVFSGEKWVQPQSWWGWGPGKGKDKDKDKDKDKGRGRSGKKKKDDHDRPHEVSHRVPKPVLEDDCVDCHRWEFGPFKDTLDSPNVVQINA